LNGAVARTALVTGTDSQGMGQAIARTLAREGADVARVEALSRELSVLGRRAPCIHGDLGDAAIARGVVRQAIEALGGVGIAVCNAGMIQRTPFLDITDTEWDRIHAVNLHGPFAVAQEVARHMMARGQGGRIVMVSSINQALANPNIAHYAASKDGVMMLARAMALELAEHAITVNLVAPGTVETDMNREMLADPAFRRQKLAPVPIGRAGTPEDVAGAVAYLASAEAGYITGSTITIDGGLTIP